MPYIKKELRRGVIMSRMAENAGELNFLITDIVTGYLIKKGEKYQTYNDIVGALENAKLEIYRRKVSLYEDKKIKENGDVY